ncbi:uncharacterized protein LOC125517237 [Triticum urartu]|uniref:uncharacterized protein LOC125517237 n=1 Tax=Triticum urartu TaxID=4572 RepID=UPI002043D93F|nr:uncharacterized protein LOC125517237 [Triticum urartu]
METPFSTDPPTPTHGWIDGAHQFWRWRRRIRTHLRDGGRPHRDPPPALGLVRHTGPHRRLLLRWSSTTAHLRRDLDAQGMHTWLVTSRAAIAGGWLAGWTGVRGAGVLQPYISGKTLAKMCACQDSCGSRLIGEITFVLKCYASVICYAN